MQDQILEQYFTAIKEDSNQVFDLIKHLELKIEQGFIEIRSNLGTILEIVRIYDVEKKEIKASLWEFDRRLIKLERNSV
jgi:hypothetical protein